MMKHKLLVLALGLLPCFVFADNMQPLRGEEASNPPPAIATMQRQNNMQAEYATQSQTMQANGASSSSNIMYKWNPKCAMVQSPDGLYSVPNQYCNF